MPRHLRLVAFAALVLSLAFAHRPAAQSPVQPPGWDADVRLPEAVDVNPDPHIVEVALDARVARVQYAPGQFVDAWTYDGGLPGPLIRVRVGDRLIVHFTNHLPTPTTVHWHGLRVPIQMDGVPGHSQPEVQPNGSFTYDFVVPDAGLFWYHPHVMSAAQVGFGLYGALLVEDPNDGIGAADELVLVVSDIEVTSEGKLESPDTGGSAGMAFGREGNHVLINGREGRRLVARPGARQRWRLVNAAKSRYVRLAIEGQRFTIVGADGGLIEYPIEKESIVLAPGERADVLVAPRAAAKSELVLRSFLYDRGFGSTETRQPFDDLMTIVMANLPASPPAAPPQLRRTIEPISTVGATRVDMDLTIDRLPNGSFQYGINGTPFSEGKPIRAALGETQVWTISNKTKWSHPFHIHGFFFQVLDERGLPVRPMAWKDTVDVPYEQTVRFVVRFDDRAGMWMYHCHILDHADGGLMGMIELGGAHAEHDHR